MGEFEAGCFGNRDGGMTRPDSLVLLLHLCDSLFPIGAFAYSDGLESATSAGLVRDAADLRGWLDVCLDESVRRCDGPAIAIASQALLSGDWEPIIAVDQETAALRPAASVRKASRAMGLRLLKTWHALHPDDRVQGALARVETRALVPTLAVAFALVSTCAGVDRRSALVGYAYTRLAATVSAAMRLIPLGQGDAHALLSRVLERVPAMADGVLDGPARVESFTPAMDIAAMTQQFVGSRLFRS
jgi:urease accessory protein